MSTVVTVNTYTHAVTYVADNLLVCVQEIIRLSGLDPGKIAGEWSVLSRGISKWLETQHLRAVTLEVFTPGANSLVGRWDFSIAYSWDGGDGKSWVDPDQIKYAILKQGVWPSTCNYRVIADTKAGRPDVDGWTSTSYLSTEGFVRQSIGTTVDASGLGASATYYRKV